MSSQKIVAKIILLVCLLGTQCSYSDSIYLKSFKNYELTETIFELGLYDSLFITVEQELYNTIVKVHYNGTRKALEPYWDGTFRVSNDSILLGIEYIKTKDPKPDLTTLSYYIGTVVHHYEFNKIDTSKYHFYSDWFVPVHKRIYQGDEQEKY